MLVVVTVVFLLIHLIPGDPVAVILGPEANAQQIEDARRELGLDRPLHEQLLRFYARLLRGDLGRSYFLDRPVTQALWERAEPTVVLMAAAMFVAVLIGVLTAIVAGVYQGSWWDGGLMTAALLGVCVPGFWLSLNFTYLFSVRLGWLPVAGYASVFQDPVAAARYMLLPAVSLGFNQSALIARIARSCMIEVLRQDYIRTARAKGLAERSVIFLHAFRNALVPVVTVIGITMAILIGGAVVTEIVFNIPGLGRLIISAILRRGYPGAHGGRLLTGPAPSPRQPLPRVLLHGRRVSLLVGGVTMVLASLGGGVIGVVAGSSRGLDLVIMRVMDGLMAFPAILLAIALMAVRGPGVWNVIFSLSIVYLPRTAMLIRSTALSVRELDYVLAAQALGRGGLAIAFRHILPNCVGPLLVQGTFIFAYAVLAEAILGFLGVGVPPYVPSWGNVIASGKNVIREAFWVSAFPGLALTLAGLSLNLLGDGLRDTLDPRLRTE